jgi:chromosome segregation ATPase
MIRPSRRWLLLAALLLGGWPPFVHADRRDDIINQIVNIKDHLARIDKDLEAQNDQIKQVQARIDELQQKVEPAKADAATAKQEAQEARSKLEELRKALTAATAKFAEVSKRLAADLEKNPPTSDLAKAFDEARKANEAALEKALVPLRQSPAYQVTLKSAQDAAAQIEAVRKSGAAGPDEIASAAAFARDRESAVKKLEAQVTDADPACQQAQVKLTAAIVTLRDQRAKNDAAVLQNPEYVAAKKAMEEARTAANAGQAALTAALRKQGAADAVVAQASVQLPPLQAAMQRLEAEKKVNDDRKARRQHDIDDLRKEYDRIRRSGG